MSKRLELGQAIKGHNISKAYNLKSLGAPKFKAPEPALPSMQNVEVVAVVQPAAKPPRVKETVAESDAPTYKVSKGYFRLNHAIWVDERLDLPGDAFRLFLWMLSRAWGFKDARGLIVASHSYMEVGARISRAGVARAVSLLVARGLIERLELTEKKHGRSGMSYRVMPIGVPGEESSHDESAQNDGTPQELSQSGGTVASDRGNSSLNLSDQLPQNEGQLRTLQESYENSHTPGAHGLGTLGDVDQVSEVVKYLREIKAPRQRESEQRAYAELLSAYSAQDVNDAYRLLVSKPQQFSAESIHSPLGFLTRAMDGVMSVVRDRSRAAEIREARSEREIAEAREIELGEERYREAERRFCEAFPSIEMQEAEIGRLLAGTAFEFTGEMRRRVGIDRWILDQ
jgi:hypothetical protein